MGITKTENFTQEQNAIACLAKVLGHPARIAILEYIIKSQSCVCGRPKRTIVLSTGVWLV